MPLIPIETIRAGCGEELLCLIVSQETGDDEMGSCQTALVHQTHAVHLLELQMGLKGKADDGGEGVPEKAFDIWPLHAFWTAEESDIVSVASVF
ncbi:hypothetical protein NDU88_001569 [Pleurodeles waltl]|uniref:Uncharacterized protein n=1 Tax=Pleurodeles waltl TaxID=8319 RepID=A0AAV7WMC3_PLEWA|nr:hypothetical protein NDU88_001569 [Pleurodeles waltl]